MANRFKVGDEVIYARAGLFDQEKQCHLDTANLRVGDRCQIIGMPVVGFVDWYETNNSNGIYLRAEHFDPIPNGPPTITDSHGVERRVVALSDLLAAIDNGWAEWFRGNGGETIASNEAIKQAVRKLFNHEVDDGN